MNTTPSPTMALDLALEVADLGSWDVDLETGATTWNRRHAVIQGYAPDRPAPTMQDWRRRIHPDDLAMVMDALERARSTRGLFAVEHRVLRPDTPDVRWLSLRGRFIYDDGGQPRRITGVSFDITDRKRAEERQRESEARFRNMANHAPVMVWMTEPDGRCSFLSERWCAFTGQTPDAGLGFGRLDAVHPDDRDEAGRAFETATRERRAFELEYRLRRHDGVYRWAIDAAAPRLSDTGEFLGFIGSVLDITARKEAEEELERRRADLQTMLDLLPVGVAVASDARAEHISVSPLLARLLRLDDPSQNASFTGPMQGRHRYRYQRAGVDLSGEELPMQRACLHGVDVRDEEIDVLFDDGARLTLLVSAAPLFDERGCVRGAIATHVDVSALKDVQRALERADRQKDEFLAVLAHELRNPLAPMRYASRMLRGSPARETVEEAGRVIERQLAHMSRLLDDLLDTSRITRGALQLQFSTVDIRGVVATAAEAIRPLVDKSRQALAVRVPAFPLLVDGDATRLAQIVGNLLNNANKYTDPGGDIVVEAELAGDAVIVAVRDTGIGMTEELKGRIFDLFTQGERRGRDATGLGIGLALARRLAELHDGSLQAYSDGPARGSRFVLRLPRASVDAVPDARTAEEADVRNPHAAAERVLVVDDNRDAANALARVLTGAGYPTHVAYDGSGALALAATVRPTIVLLDLGMPGIDGHEVARRLRSESWSARTRLIAITGWGRDEDRRRSRDAGIEAHLTKPVDPGLLLRLLATRGASDVQKGV